MRKTLGVLLSMVIGFFAAQTLAVKSSADTDTIGTAYQGYYYNETDDYYLLALTGSTSISFRGQYDAKIIAGNTPSAIFFSPAASGTPDNFQTTFSNYALLLSGDDYFTHQNGSISIAAHYYMSTGKFRMNATASIYHYYSR
jgi:hypothetical protein